MHVGTFGVLLFTKKMCKCFENTNFVSLFFCLFRQIICYKIYRTILNCYWDDCFHSNDFLNKKQWSLNMLKGFVCAKCICLSLRTILLASWKSEMQFPFFCKPICLKVASHISNCQCHLYGFTLICLLFNAFAKLC